MKKKNQKVLQKYIIRSRNNWRFLLFFSNFRLQDIDGGFFEKFGSLLRHKSELNEPEPVTQLAPLLETRFGEEDEPEIYTATDVNSNLEATAVAFSAPIAEYTENEEPGSGASSESEDNGNKMGRREEFLVDAVGMNVSLIFLFVNQILWHSSSLMIACRFF